jgi:hypothetical protein
MSRIETVPSATLLRFLTTEPAGGSATGAPSRREIERAIARGRRLQGEALRNGVRWLYRVLVGGCSLRSLRLPGEVNAGRRSCC